MKKIFLFAAIVTLALTGAMVSCYFDAARDNPNDPKSNSVTPTDIYLFNGGQYTGALGGRSGADDKCIKARDSIGSSLPSKNVHAFISVESGDAIADMPSKYGVPTDRQIRIPNGSITLAANWADLLSIGSGTSLGASLKAAGVLPDSTSWWWSGSNGDGTLDSNCTGWTLGAGGAYGTYGNPEKTNEVEWIKVNDRECQNMTYILCISWN